ncbi:MAG: DUF3592 domain-containing protein [Gemmatimonadetes bacterium]|nr:DUF3592 domain-containing protein [Gemmatimonadota bacterium]
MSHQPPSRFAIAVCVLLALVGSVGAVGSWGAYLTDSRLERSGPRAVGLVTDSHVSRAADGETDYIVEYTFALPSGREVASQRGVSQRLWSQLRRGERVTVVYSAKQPGRNFPLGAGVTSLGLTIFGSCSPRRSRPWGMPCCSASGTSAVVPDEPRGWCASEWAPPACFAPRLRRAPAGNCRPSVR